MTRVIIPQMIRVTLPSIGNEAITLVKDTALVASIALPELLHYAKGIVTRDFTTTPFLVAAFIYLLITFVVTLLFKFAEKKTITIKEETAMSVIEVQNLRKNFGSLEVLRDVSFSVEKGDVVAIIGSSGSGKSTLLRCLIDLETVSGGTIVIDGHTLCRDGAYVSVKEKKAITLGMGMVFQHFNLYPHLSVMQNLEIAPRLVKNRHGSELREQAMDLLTKVGMADRANEMPGRLSGGQKQRVAIARALMMQSGYSAL